MHDLRKQALLESGKTMSRKARSKQPTASPAGSRANSTTPSRQGSRVASANVSDDEGDFSDGTQWSTNSIDEVIAPAEGGDDVAPDAWIAHLGDRINELCDRKRSSVQGREETLSGFITDLTRHYAREEIRGKMTELLPAILKSVKGGQTERETVLALKALALVLVTDPSDTIYDLVAGPIKATIVGASHPAAKVAAIHTLSIATFYGGATTEETESVMSFFLDIASSDGASVEEADNSSVVTAALESWGFLATQLEDFEDGTEEAMETFVDQLESSAVDVQIAAGENVALLFEKSYTEAESDDEPEGQHHHDGGSDDSDEPIHGHGSGGPRMIKRYTPYRQQYQLEKQLEDLAKTSSRRLSKKDRKALHLAMSDILHTVEKPTRGPRYSTALDKDGFEMGSRLKVAVLPGADREKGRMTIDAWWKLHRLNGLKRLLREGFGVHFENNEVVGESLPGGADAE